MFGIFCYKCKGNGKALAILRIFDRKKSKMVHIAT